MKKHEGRLQDILGMDFMADIHDGGLRIEAEYDALHHSDVRVTQAEVCQEGDYFIR